MLASGTNKNACIRMRDARLERNIFVSFNIFIIARIFGIGQLVRSRVDRKCLCLCVCQQIMLAEQNWNNSNFVVSNFEHKDRLDMCLCIWVHLLCIYEHLHSKIEKLYSVVVLPKLQLLLSMEKSFPFNFDCHTKFQCYICSCTKTSGEIA